MSSIPKIRFKGFTDDWEQRKFGDIFSVSQGLQIPIKDRFIEDGENRYFYITNEFLKDSCAEAYYIESPSESVICDEEDILMTRTGNTGVVVTDVNGCFHNNFFKIKYDKTEFSKRFIFYLLLSPIMQKIILNSAGNSTIPDLSHKNFYKISSRFPSSKDEQNRVGKFLFHLDHLITLHQQKCNNIKFLKKYMLQKMFPQNGEKIPKIRFNGFMEEWEQRKLGDLASSFEYGLNAAAKEYDGENKYIRITDIEDESREFNQTNVTSPDIDLENAESYKLAKGDILFARTGASVGKSYIYKNSDGLVYYAGFLIRARVKDEYDAEFVFQNTLTDRYNKYIAVTSQRSGQPGVNAQEYSEFEIQVPQKEEQTKIGTYFRNLDYLITLHQRKCNELKELKKYMLQNMFPQKG